MGGNKQVEKMTPKEKAEQLITLFLGRLYNDGEFSFKQYLRGKAIVCAIICVDEILKACPVEMVGNAGKFIYTDQYWNEVRSELEKL